MPNISTQYGISVILASSSSSTRKVQITMQNQYLLRVYNLCPEGFIMVPMPFSFSGTEAPLLQKNSSQFYKINIKLEEEKIPAYH